MSLLSTIESFEKDKGSCFASNDYLAAHLHCTPNTIGNKLRTLQDKGFIKRQGNGHNRTINIIHDAMVNRMNTTKIVEVENTTKIVETVASDDSPTSDNTTKIVEQLPKNCDVTPQNLGAISTYDKDIDIISSRRKVLDNNIYINSAIHDSGAKNTTSDNTTKFVLPDSDSPHDLKRVIYDVVVELTGRSTISLKDYQKAIDDGFTVSQIIYAALQTKNCADNMIAGHRFLNSLKYKPSTTAESDELAAKIEKEMTR